MPGLQPALTRAASPQTRSAACRGVPAHRAGGRQQRLTRSAPRIRSPVPTPAARRRRPSWHLPAKSGRGSRSGILPRQRSSGPKPPSLPAGRRRHGRRQDPSVRTAGRRQCCRTAGTAGAPGPEIAQTGHRPLRRKAAPPSARAREGRGTRYRRILLGTGSPVAVNRKPPEAGRRSRHNLPAPRRADVAVFPAGAAHRAADDRTACRPPPRETRRSALPPARPKPCPPP